MLQYPHQPRLQGPSSCWMGTRPIIDQNMVPFVPRPNLGAAISYTARAGKLNRQIEMASQSIFIKRSAPKKGEIAARHHLSALLPFLLGYVHPGFVHSLVCLCPSVAKWQIIVHEPEARLPSGKSGSNNPTVGSPIGCHCASRGHTSQHPSLRLPSAR
jgi:hypothetical protein